MKSLIRFITVTILKTMSIVYRRKLKYPQTWGMAVKIRKRSIRLYEFAVWLCGKLTGHEISKTEWGYGGGEMADYHCRWCDKLIQMPMREETNEMRIDLAKEMGDD